VPNTPKFTVYVKYVNIKTKEDDMRDFFKDCKILTFEFLILDGKRKIAKVGLEDRESLIKALAKNSEKFFSTRIRVDLESANKNIAIDCSNEAAWRRAALPTTKSDAEAQTNC
jgi:RNA recognition motif-containing protein